jgi:hypothetical protein
MEETHVTVAAVMTTETTITASSSFVAMFASLKLYTPFCGVSRAIIYFPFCERPSVDEGLLYNRSN